MQRRLAILAFASLVVAVLLSSGTKTVNSGVSPKGEHVRWDIIHLNTSTTPPTLSSGGEAFASAITGSTPSGLRIRLTGSGTFVAPASGKTSSGVTGGGTWETFGPGGVSTGSGTYEVKKLLSWQFATFQNGGTNLDEIDDPRHGADGNAILLIEYSDGSEGILGVGCDGSPSPAGILEGIIATKGYFTYWNREAPVAGVDANRTDFHVS